ncbi:ataxin-2 homolog isoform X1 [Plutella xylostella]|uniref:ataxin-2 homolog isoform X1 n=1 Tax=Plutella xylostella TaxID=51655 RepID=UPI002032719C|nr:ataxin-2 homolog isoform X1 [Plutella xylostella]
MSGGLVDKVYIGLDNAPAAFDIKGRILGPNGTNLEYIRSETGVVPVLKGDKFEPLHLALHHARAEAIGAAKSLALNLIETIKAELIQWSAAQGAGPPPALNVPPPTLTTSSAAPPAPSAPPAPLTMTTPSSLASAQPAVLPPVVSVPAAPAPLMTVRQPTVLQLLQPQQHQQQYVLNQESGQLIPIVQPGQMHNSLTSLPLGQSLSSLQQPNFGTQLVDLSSMQPVNVTQLRLSGVPSSMSMILPNGLLQQGMNTLNANDTTTVSTATSTPVVCAAQNTNSSQKILYSTDKVGEKTDIKYQIQGSDTVQWSMPGSQTMLIPYQQLQDSGLANIQHQQFVSIAPAGGLPQTSLPLTAAQFQQLQATGTIMHLNQKPITCSGSLINIISTGQASSPQIISSSATPTKLNNQDQRGQKRLSDGTPSQLQLRPIAPAGSHVSQEKGSTRDTRSWQTASARDNTVVSMGMKINPAHGTIIHVSSGQQTSVSTTGVTQDGSGMYIRHIDRNQIQIQGKDIQKQDAGKIPGQMQMINLPAGMVLQSPLGLGQVPVLGQPNSQVYMIPANQSNLLQQGGLPQGFQQMLQPGQNVTVMQPNQLGMHNNVQYNVPLMHMNMQPNTQYISGLNLNSQFSAQQLNAALGQQLGNLGSIPIVQAPPGSPMPQAPASQQQQIQQILPQNSFLAPTSQYNLPQQYVMQQSQPMSQPVQYSQPAPPSAPAADTEAPPNGTTATNQNNYITSSQENFTIASNQNTASASQQNFQSETATPPTTVYAGSNQTANTQNYTATNGSSTPAYSAPPATTQPPPYNAAAAPAQNVPQPYTPPTVQNVSQANYSPSATPVPNQTYTAPGLPNTQFQQGNPYPNATGQNMAAYANNQYQYNMQAPSRPWFRPRYASPQGSPYPPAQPPAPPAPLQVPPPQPNYNYWQENS